MFSYVPKRSTEDNMNKGLPVFISLTACHRYHSAMPAGEASSIRQYIVWGEWISILSKTNIVISGFWQRPNASLRLRSPKRWRRMRRGLRKLACRRQTHSCVSTTCLLIELRLLLFLSFRPANLSLFLSSFLLSFSLSPCPSSSPLFISMLSLTRLSGDFWCQKWAEQL